jgi:protoporphyrinogen oxidase
LNVKTAILGGGLTGITLARLLHAKGDEVVVLEREPEYGGLCRSRCESGFTFDRGGSHIIFSRDEAVLSFMLDALGKNRQVNQRNTKVFFKNRYIKYPFENGLYQLEKDDLFFCINEFIRTLIAVERGELPPPQNFKEWITYTFGKGIADLYLIPYNEKIWKYPTDRMSLHWVEGRVPRPPVEDIIKSAIGIETEGYTHQSLFSYPLHGGIEALIHALAAPIREQIQTGFSVSSVVRENGVFTISDGRGTVAADRCISTIPLHELMKCLDSVPESILQSCDQLKYNSLVCVLIGIRGKVPDISWAYIPEENLGLFNRISFPSNYSPYVAPEGCSSILIEITYHEGDPVSSMSDQDITDHVISGLQRMGIVSERCDIAYAGLERQKYAYIIYNLDYMQHVAAVRGFCREKGIILSGRFAEFEYLNMDGCIRSAMECVRGLG